MKPACPSEDRLKSLIMEAFDELPTPDPARMQRIATTLSRRTRRTKKPQHSWLFWLLLGGSMSAAAWFINEKISLTSKANTDVIQQQKPSILILPAPVEDTQAKKKPLSKKPSVTNRTFIDQREQY